MMRAVLDANVLASALIQPQGPSGRAIAALFGTGAFTLVASPSILEETRRCIFYPRVGRRIACSDEEIAAYLTSLALVGDIVSPSQERIGAVEREPDDDKYLAAALEGLATYVVTGDRDLLEIGDYQGVRIVPPAAFVRVLGL